MWDYFERARPVNNKHPAGLSPAGRRYNQKGSLELSPAEELCSRVVYCWRWLISQEVIPPRMDTRLPRRGLFAKTHRRLPGGKTAAVDRRARIPRGTVLIGRRRAPEPTYRATATGTALACIWIGSYKGTRGTHV